MKKHNLSNSTYTFGAVYQIKLLKLMCTDLNFMNRHRHLIEPHYFDNVVSQDVCRVAIDYYDTYKTVPTVDAINVSIEEVLQVDQRKAKLAESYKEALQSIRESAVEELPDISARVVEFAQQSAAIIAVDKCMDDLEAGDTTKILDRLKVALSVGADDDDIGIDYFEDVTRFSWTRNEETIGTGLPTLDKHLGGGIAVGEHGILAGTTGGFKSGTLINFAANAIEQGCQVVYITLELSAIVVGKRFDKKIANRFKGLPPEIVYSEAFRDKLLDYRKRFRGSLVIYGPQGDTTVNSLRAYFTRLKDKGHICKPGKKTLVVIDYPKLMKADRRYEKDIAALASCYDGCTELAKEFKFAIWTAAQVTRIASSRQKKGGGFASKVYDKEDLAECWAIGHGVDVIATVNQDLDDAENNVGRIALVKVREAADSRVVDVEIDKANMHVTELPEQKSSMTIKKRKSRRITEIKDTYDEAGNHAEN